jgi:hypothetical protein
MISKLKYIIPIAAILVLASCKKDYLNINNDPNNPTDAPIDLLLPTAERTLGDALSMGGGDNGGLSQILEVWVHRITTREEADQYATKGNEFFLGLAWPKFYSSSPPPGASEPLYGIFSNLDEIIKKSTVDGNLYYRGVARTLKAYAFSQLCDAFADIPFSEADQISNPDNPIAYPKFDDDQEIYPKLLDTLNAALQDFSVAQADAGALQPGGDDVIYQGDITKWIKAANTIKLKLLTQVRKVQSVGADVTALLADPTQLLESTSESFLLPYGPKGATDDRNPAYQEWFSAQRSNHISPWFYEILKGENTNINTGIEDPRIPYYFYNQLRPDEPAENQTEYRDGAFASIYFGSVGPDRDRNNQNTLTTLGVYPAGGLYDDGSAGGSGDANGVDGTESTGAAPYRFITYADRLYLEAELINEGLAPGNARDVLEQAMIESFATVDMVVEMAAPPQSIPQLVPGGSPDSTVQAYIDAVLADFDAGSAARKLEIIMTQKWIQSFGNAVDAYTDYRRTGYPIMWDPSNTSMAPGGFAQPPLNGDPFQPNQKKVPVILTSAYPAFLPWEDNELETNANAPSQSDHTKPFWMP